MSSLIAKQPKDPKKQTTVSLSQTVLSDLELYCQFIDSTRDWVVNQALRKVFQRDKAFLEWKERPAARAPQPAPAASSVKPGQAQLPLHRTPAPATSSAA